MRKLITALNVSMCLLGGIAVCLFFLYFNSLPLPVHADERVYRQAEKERIFNATLINATAKVCSGYQVSHRIGHISVQWIATSVSGTADVTLTVEGSIDEVVYVTPGGVADIATNDTTETTRIEGVYMPLVLRFAICVTGAAANPADTIITAWRARQ